MKLGERLLAPLLFFLLAVYALNLSVYKPFHNWDMIFYIAAAKSFEEREVKSLHSFTYNQLRKSVSNTTYEDLVRDSFRHDISTDSTAFKELLPFYQIRPVYTGIIYLLYKTGVNIVFATHIISGIAVVVAVVFLYLMSVSFLVKPLVYAAPPIAMIVNMLDLARFSTPDGLAFMAVILSAYLYQKNRIAPLQLLLPMMVGIRNDLVLFSIPLLCCIFFLESGRRWSTALSIFISVVIYIGIGVYWRNPGWSTIFCFTLTQLTTHPISMPPTLTTELYFYTLFSLTKLLIDNKLFMLYVFISAYSLYLMMHQAMTTSVVITLKSASTVLSLVCIFFVVSHFIAFPVAWDRFFSAPYLIGAFSLMVMTTNYLNESKYYDRNVVTCTNERAR